MFIVVLIICLVYTYYYFKFLISLKKHINVILIILLGIAFFTPFNLIAFIIILCIKISYIRPILIQHEN